MTLLLICKYYLYAGTAVAAVFLSYGLGRVDENAQGAWVFRPLLIPGVLLIWPLVIWRWAVLQRGEQKLDRHRMPRIVQDRAQLGFIVAIVGVLILAFVVRQDPASLAAPVLLEEPQ